MNIGTTAFGEGSINRERSRRMETDKAEGGVLETDPHAEHINVCIWTAPWQLTNQENAHESLLLVLF